MAREELEGVTVEQTRASGLKERKVFISTDERYKAFLKRIRNSLDEESTAAWKEVVQEGYCPEMPLQILCAPSVICDKACPMCYTTIDEYRDNIQRPATRVGAAVLPPGVFKEMFREIDEWNLSDQPDKMYGFKFSPGGEPLLNRDMLRIIETVRSSTFDYDLFLMTAIPQAWSVDRWEKFCRQIVNLDVNTVSISAEGWDKASYEAMRVNGDFADFVEKLRILRETRDGYSKTGKPGIRWQTIITPYLPGNEKMQTAIDSFGHLADIISVNGEVDYREEDSGEEIVRNNSFSCYEPRARMMFYPGPGNDGRPSLIAAQCVNDEKLRQTIGTFPDQSIFDIWHGDKIEAVRRSHAENKGWQEYPSTCGVCYLPRETESGSRLSLNLDGENIGIESFKYVGRNKQGTALERVVSEIGGNLE